MSILIRELAASLVEKRLETKAANATPPMPPPLQKNQIISKFQAAQLRETHMMATRTSGAPSEQFSSLNEGIDSVLWHCFCGLEVDEDDTRSDINWSSLAVLQQDDDSSQGEAEEEDLDLPYPYVVDLKMNMNVFADSEKKALLEWSVPAAVLRSATVESSRRSPSYEPSFPLRCPLRPNSSQFLFPRRIVLLLEPSRTFWAIPLHEKRTVFSRSSTSPRMAGCPSPARTRICSLPAWTHAQKSHSLYETYVFSYRTTTY